MTVCSSLSELLSGHLDGELAPDEAQRVEAHLADCAACAAEVEALRRAGRVVATTLQRSAASADFSDFTERVLERIDAGTEEAPAAMEAGGTLHWLREHRGPVVALAAAAIVLLALLLGPLLFPSGATGADEADVVVELIDPPEGYDAMIFNEGDEGKNITVIWLIEQEPEPDTTKEPAL